MFPTALAFTKPISASAGSRRLVTTAKPPLLARCGLLMIVAVACFGVLQPKKAITFPLGTIPAN